MDRSELLVEIRRLIITELDLRGRSEAELDFEAPLFGTALGLDSLDALQIATALEERFGVSIPEGEEARKVFTSISAIADYVAGACKR